MSPGYIAIERFGGPTLEVLELAAVPTEHILGYEGRVSHSIWITVNQGVSGYVTTFRCQDKWRRWKPAVEVCNDHLDCVPVHQLVKYPKSNFLNGKPSAERN